MLEEFSGGVAWRQVEEAVGHVFVETIFITVNQHGQHGPLAWEKGQWSSSVGSIFPPAPFNYTVVGYWPLLQCQIFKNPNLGQLCHFSFFFKGNCKQEKLKQASF